MNKPFLFLSIALLTLASCSNDDETATVAETSTSTGAIKQPLVGGPNQPNQAFLDLSTETTTAVNRAT